GVTHDRPRVVDVRSACFHGVFLGRRRRAVWEQRRWLAVLRAVLLIASGPPSGDGTLVSGMRSFGCPGSRLAESSEGRSNHVRHRVQPAMAMAGWGAPYSLGEPQPGRTARSGHTARTIAG